MLLAAKKHPEKNNEYLYPWNHLSEKNYGPDF